MKEPIKKFVYGRQKDLTVWMLILITSSLTACGALGVPPDSNELAVEVTVAASQTVIETAAAGTIEAMTVTQTPLSTFEANEVTEVSATSVEPSGDAVSDQATETMQIVIDKTRHYIGDPKAPVVLIEVSDFM